MEKEGLTEDEIALLTTPSPDSQPLSTVTEVRDTDTRDTDIHDAEDLAHSSLLELHRAFAPTLANITTRFAQRNVTVSLRDQSASTYSRFVFGQLVPTCCAVVRATAADLEFWVSIQPSIAYPLVDRMLGSCQSEPVPQRPMSEIEAGLLQILFGELVGSYGDAWQQALSLGLTVDRLVHNVQQLGVLPGSEATWRVRYEVRCGQDYGIVELCLPWASTRQLRQRLAACQ